MKKYLLSFCFLFSTSMAMACSCFFIDNFCESISPDNIANYNILRGEVIQTYEANYMGYILPLMDVQIQDQYHGTTMNLDTITIVGQDGVNCNTSLGPFSVGKEMVFWIGTHTSFVPNEIENDLNYVPYDLSGCSVSYLFVENGQVQGAIRPDLNTQDLDDFVNDLMSCIDFTVNTVEEEALSRVEVMPNPSTDFINVYHEGIDLVQISLFNTIGQKISNTNLTISGGQDFQQISVAGLPTGVYNLVLETENARRALRIVVQP